MWGPAAPTPPVTMNLPILDANSFPIDAIIAVTGIEQPKKLMAKIRLTSGVWPNAISIVLGGGGAVTGAASTQAALQVVGFAGMTLGIGHLMWGITVNDEHWWSRGRIQMTWPYALMTVSLAGFLVGGFFAARGRSNSEKSLVTASPAASTQPHVIPDPRTLDQTTTKSATVDATTPKISVSRDNQSSMPLAVISPTSATAPIIDQSVTSNNQSGGITAHTVNLGTPAFKLTQQDLDDLIRNLNSEKHRMVHILSANTNSSIENANIINGHLSRNGFQFDGGITRALAWSQIPANPITISWDKDKPTDPIFITIDTTVEPRN